MLSSAEDPAQADSNISLGSDIFIKNNTFKQDMKTLVAYYSRTGVTKRVAEELAKELKADKEEIIDLKDRSGPIGYMKGGRDALRQSGTNIKKTRKDPSKYDLLVIGTPIWVGTMAPAIKTYLQTNKPRKIAFFSTMGGSGDERAYGHMRKISKKPKATLTLLTKEVMNGDAEHKVTAFAKGLKKA